MNIKFKGIKLPIEEAHEYVSFLFESSNNTTFIKRKLARKKAKKLSLKLIRA